jgi:hypothetical protein
MYALLNPSPHLIGHRNKEKGRLKNASLVIYKITGL